MVQRWFQVACVTLAITVAAVALKRHLPAAESAARQQEAIAGAIEKLNLYAVCDPPNRASGYRLILSERPIPPNWQVRLNNINHPDFARWQGAVAVYVGHPKLIGSSAVPEHAERYAVWAGSFVFGDPALIARLQSACP